MATATGEWACTAEEYHAERDHVSHSALDVFRTSRRLYRGRFVTGDIPAPEPTPAMRLGTLFHLAVLEPARFAESVVVRPKFDMRTNAGKASNAEWFALNGGKISADQGDYDLVQAIAVAVQSNEIAARWLAKPGKSEHSVTWQDNETGLMCKSRRDRVLDDVLIDLKTCRDPSPEGFAKAAAAFGYNRQAPWYLDGEKASGGNATSFMFIAVGTSPPHEVACYELDNDAIDLGRRQNRKALFELADCIQYDDWLGPHEKQITTLKLPKWAEYSDFDLT